MVLANSTKNEIRLSRIQKLIGKRMALSKAAKPCFYLSAKADVTELLKLRPKLRKSLGVKITTNAFYLRALGLATEKYPLMLGRLEGDNIKLAEQINIGFAVNAPQGLVVPIVKNVNEKTLAQIAEDEKQLTEKGRSNKLTVAELEGETIALSNLGAYGIDSFIGIIPPPASAILSVGNAIEEIVPNDGRPAARKRVSLTIAVDHCVINGDYAAKFLGCIKEYLQNQQQLL